MTRRAGWPVFVGAAAIVLAEFASVALLAAGAPAGGQIYLPPGGVLARRALPSLSNGPALILGQVVDAATGRGVSHAIVRVQGPGGELTQVADDTGRFFAAGLKGGSYQIDATKSGYLDGAYGRLRAGGQSLPLGVIDHQWVADVRVTMWRPAVIAGYVTDELGEPVVNARVEALRRDDDSGTRDFAPAAWDVTDDEGAYRLASLMPGEYRIVVPAGVTALPGAPTALADAIVGAHDAQLDAAERSAAASAIADSLVRSGQVRIGASGPRVTMSTLNLTAAAHANTPTVYPTTYFPAALTAGTALSVTLASGETRSRVDVQLMPVAGGTISGTVVGPSGPRANQTLRLIAAGEDDPGLGREVANTISSTDGAFEFPAVPQGDYVIDATSRVRADVGFVIDDNSDAPALAVPLSARMTVPETPPDDGRPLWGRTEVSLWDRRADDVVVTMDVAGGLSGLAVFESATPPPENLPQHFGIDAIPVAGTEPVPAHATVWDDHTFAITGLARGEYFLRVTAPAGWFLKSVTSGLRDLLTTPVDLTSASEFADLIVTFTDKPTEIAGAVQDGKRAPVASATVVVFPAERSFRGAGLLGPERVRAVRVDVSGAFHLVGLPPGDYLIAAIDEATAAGWQDPSRLEALRRVATRVVINAGEARGLQLELPARR